ncbi:MAG: tetratricopeptide repeat protein [Chloroflexi bacterium]|nr:MAG: tetratricopeptide repeat protein [Chloroflexota bacterium]
MTVASRRPDRTRYAPPSLPLPLLQRQRLLDRLGGADRHRLTLVHAAAGYGKTTLLAQHADLLRASGRRMAWLTLQRGDEDPLVLFTDLVGALRRDDAEFGDQLLSSLEHGRRLERRLPQLAQALADELAPLGDLVFFVDDHPSVQGASLATFGSELVELLPDNAHLVLATRRTPQLSGLPRWRLAGSVLDISAAELAFTRSEAIELLRGEFGLDLPEHAVDAIYGRTGGWPAGLRLAAAFVRERGWRELGEFRGSGAELYAYFNSEVLGRGSREDQDRLLRWSLLERLEEDESVSAGGASRELVASLEGAGLVIRDGAAGAGHRFQPLFAEFLHARARELLPAAEIVELHRGHAERALARGDVDRAIHHLQQAGEHKRAAQLVRDHGERVLQGSEVATLQRWLDGFPPGVERRLPWVLLLRGLLHRVRGDYERALAHYRDAADQLRRARDEEGLARALTWSAQALRYLRRPGQALAEARGAQELIGEGASSQAAWIWHLIGGCHADLGELEQATTAHLKAEAMFSLLSDRTGELAEALALAQLHHLLGELDVAQRTYLRALALQQKSADVTALCWAEAGLVDVRTRRGDTAEALDTLRQTLEIASANDLRLAQAAMCATLMTVHSLAAERGAVEEVYRAGVELSRDQGDDRIIAELHATAAELRALRGEATSAHDALRAAEAIAASSSGPVAGIRAAIARGAILEAEGDRDGAFKAYGEARASAGAIGARYLEVKATLLATAVADWVVEATKPALRAVAAERYRDFLLLRPALAEALRQRLPDLEIPPDETRSLALLLQPAPVVPAASQGVPSAAAESIQAFMLGPFELRASGARISDRGWRTSKAKELFALMLLDRQRAISRDELVAQLWPETDAASALSNFHFTLHALRKALASAGASEATSVVRTDAGYRLALPLSIHVDLEVFRRSLRRGREAREAGRSREAVQHLRAAVAVHRGEFLADLSAPWIDRNREETNRQLVGAAKELATLELEWKEPREAIRPLEKLLQREPYDEEAHRLLMRAHHESGDAALAMRHYQALEAMLRRDLGAEPEAATRELYQRIKRTGG